MTPPVMRLGFSAWAMQERPVAEQIEIVRTTGYASITLVSGADLGLDALTANAGERRRIRERLDRAALELSAITGHADPLAAEPARREASRTRIRATIDLAADLAGPGGPPCVVTMGRGTPEQYAQERGALADAFGELAAHARTRGVVIALEPHVGQMIDRPERVAWLVEAVGSPHFRLNFDNSHFEVMGYDLADYLPQLLPFAVHTELKDQRGRFPTHEFLVPGEGEFDYARYLGAMERAGYRGCITVEISKMVQRRPGYEAREVAARSFRTLTDAAARAGVSLLTGRTT